MVHSDREGHGWSGQPVRRSVGSFITVFSGRARFRALTALVAGGILVASGGMAHADTIQDSIAADGTVTLVAGSTIGGTAAIRVIANNADGATADPGCNWDPGEAPLVLDVVTPIGVTATPDPLSITTCGQPGVTVTFMAGESAVSGTATVAISSTPAGGGGYTNQVSIPITVNQPVSTNTQPSVSVSGVADGDTYGIGSVPTAVCDVTDAETSNIPSFAAALSGTLTNGLGSQTATCDFTDVGGLEADTKTVTYQIVDLSAPVINYVLNPSSATGDNGWYRGDVSLTWTVTETDSPASLVQTGCADQTIITDQGATTYSCSATSAGGSAEEISVTIKRDATEPTITAIPTPGPNLDGYNNSSVDVTYSCSDATSDLATLCPATDHATTEGTHAFDHAIFDNAGNSSSVSTTVMLDATKPTIIGSRTTANGDGWNNTDVTVTFTCTDDRTEASGIKSCVADGTSPASNETTVSTEGVNQSVSGTATDNADNTNTATVDGINIDKTDPVITFASRTPANLAGWNNGNVTVTWTCTDVGGSGVVASPVSQIVTTEGSAQSATGTCTDVAGNTASNTHSGISIDKTNPGIAFADATPAANLAGWNNSNVTVTWNCTDLGGSGVVASPVSQTISTEGAGQSATGTCTDVAGNTASNTHSGISIDLTNPTDVAFVGGPAADASYYFGSVPAAPTCTAADAVSGLASCLVSGYSASVGSHTLTATATDNAGRTATATRSYTVLAWTLNGFYQPVDMNGVLNTVKGGSTVPLKFEVFAGSTELTSTSVVQSFNTQKVNCTSGAGTEDAIEVVSTGGTSLRYDSTGGQFIQNWKTPTGPGFCYSATMITIDGSSITALFKIK